MSALQALRIVRAFANIYSHYTGTSPRPSDIRHRNIWMKILAILQEENINEN